MITKRPLSLFERGMYLDGRTPINITFAVKVRGQLTPEQLRHALARVQEKHPLLRSLIVRENGQPWFQIQAQPVPIPLRVVERTGDDAWHEEAGRERQLLFDASREPLLRVVWMAGQGEGELMVVCHHCICDGRSVVTILREILAVCDQPDRDIGRYDSLDPVEALLPDEVVSNRGLQRRIRWKAALFKLFVRTRRLGPALTYGKMYSFRWTLDAQIVNNLSQRCKSEGVTLFNALAAAFVLSFRSVRGVRGIGKFVIPVDVRKFLPKLGGDHFFAMAPTIDLSPNTPHPEQTTDAEFWALARTLRAEIDQRVGRLGPKMIQNLIGMEYLHGLFDRLIAYSKTQRSGQNATLSYLGKTELPANYRDFQVDAVYSPAVNLEPTPANLIAIVNFAGRLDFSFTSDEFSLPYAQATAIREKSLRLLQARAGLTAPDAEALGGHVSVSPQAGTA